MEDVISMKKKPPEPKIIKPNEEDFNNVLDFRLRDERPATDGNPPSSNWLVDLDVGDIFLIKDRQSADYVLQKFEIIQKQIEDNRVVAVEIMMDQNTEVWLFVDPIRFCSRFSLVKIIGKQEYYD